MRQSKVWVSVLIVLAVGLHAVPAVTRPGQQQVLWPFLVWGMYKESRPPGPVTADKRRLVAVTERGQREEVTSNLSGLSRPTLGRSFIQPMMAGDSSAARRLLRRLNDARPTDRFVELRLEIERYTIADSGLVRQDNPVIAFRLDPSDPK